MQKTGDNGKFFQGVLVFEKKRNIIYFISSSVDENVYLATKEKIGVRKKILSLMFAVLMMMITLVGCGSFGNDQAADNHITVYLWDNGLCEEFASYVKEQCPDVEVEFISGNNNVFLYDYLEKHDELPDIMTTRRLSEADAKNLRPYLLDLSALDVVSSFYPYALQYYKEQSGDIHWLPVCGIPETMIVNKTLFDELGIEIPESYAEFTDACAVLKANGIKPYVSNLSADYSAHSLIQGAALDQFTSLKGMNWRAQAESGDMETEFDQQLWTDIFHEVNTFINDVGFGPEDANMEYDEFYELYVTRQAAITRGTTSIMVDYQSVMDDELVRLPYFSQTSDDSWIYTYPSLNIALNSNLKENKTKMDAAMQVLDCFLSEKGQNIIADGQQMISYNVDVESELNEMAGLEEEVEKNAFYIRYASNASFSASLKSVQGLLTGDMDEQQAMKTFMDDFNVNAEEEKTIAVFENTYPLTVNEEGGRDAASSVLTTIRKENSADLAFTPYYYYTASLYAGKHTLREVSNMVKNGDSDLPFAMAELKGSEVKALVKAYLADTGTEFHVTNKYELPIASGMKLILRDNGGEYELEDIQIEGQTIKDKKKYKIMIPVTFEPIFAKACPKEDSPVDLDLNLSEAWLTIVGEGQQPSEPEDYIEISE